MSKMSDIRLRIHTLDEIRSILDAMKNLSIVELNKVAHHQASQEAMADSIERALDDFERSFEFLFRNRKTENPELYILVGSERGFCGGFNETVIARLEKEVSGYPAPPGLLAVGRKIGSKLGGHPRLLDTLEGPSTTEEIPFVVSRLVARLASVPSTGWAIIHREDSPEKTLVVKPYENKTRSGTRTFPYPPLLNMPPEDLYPKLMEQYLFFLLYRSFYRSFLEENRERLRHMEGALDFLEKNLNRLKGESNLLRQEEITEELEILLLGVGE